MCVLNGQPRTLFFKKKKHRWRAWDSNPGPQDGRRRRNHGAMAATPDSFCLFSFFSNNILYKNGRLQKDSNCSSSEKKASKLTTRPLPRPVWPDGFIIFQSLAVYNYENLLHSIKFAKVGTNVCLKSNQNNCKNFWKTVKMLPKWRNFAKSGHTAHGSCNLNVKRSKFFCINFLVWQFALDDKTSHQLLLWAVPFKSVYFLALAKHWHINACLN